MYVHSITHTNSPEVSVCEVSDTLLFWYQEHSLVCFIDSQRVEFLVVMEIWRQLYSVYTLHTLFPISIL